MNEPARANILIIAIDEVLDELRDRDDPALDDHIATLEQMRAETVARLEAAPASLN
jgi:hypothetical protein